MKEIRYLLLSLLLSAACSPFNRDLPDSHSPEDPYAGLKGKTVYIIGDSYSTFQGWIPQGNLSWYPIAAKDNDVQDVSQTWWKKLCDDTGMKLLKNNSYSGSTICNTGYEGEDYSNFSFVKRMKDDFGPGKDLHPDIIFIFGGTNDYWAASPIGNFKYGDWTAGDLKNFTEATCYLFSYLKEWNPDALIINLSSRMLKAGIPERFQRAADRFRISNLPLETFNVMNGHPNIEGMAFIEKQIIELLLWETTF